MYTNPAFCLSVLATNRRGNEYGSIMESSEIQVQRIQIRTRRIRSGCNRYKIIYLVVMCFFIRYEIEGQRSEIFDFIRLTVEQGIYFACCQLATRFHILLFIFVIRLIQYWTFGFVIFQVYFQVVIHFESFSTQVAVERPFVCVRKRV